MYVDNLSILKESLQQLQFLG